MIELASCTSDDEAEFRLLALDPRLRAELLCVVLAMVRTTFPDVTPTAYANLGHAASARMLAAAGFRQDGTLTGRYGTLVTRFVHPRPGGNASPG